MSTLIKLTVAPGTTAPEASKTVPWIVPVSTCAKTGDASNSAAAMTARIGDHSFDGISSALLLKWR
jgi:hypothetical protein